MRWDVAYYVIGAAGAIVAVITGMVYAFRHLRHKLRRIGQFLDDWNGEEARPGVSRRLGVMERLESYDTMLAAIKKEITFDSGQSLKDVAVQARDGVEELRRALQEDQ